MGPGGWSEFGAALRAPIGPCTGPARRPRPSGTATWTAPSALGKRRRGRCWPSFRRGRSNGGGVASRARDEAEGGPPPGLPAKKLLILNDAEGEKALAIAFFEGERAAVEKFEVVLELEP
jgi:hypothetical protein